MQIGPLKILRILLQQLQNKEIKEPSTGGLQANKTQQEHTVIIKRTSQHINKHTRDTNLTTYRYLGVLYLFLS